MVQPTLPIIPELAIVYGTVIKESHLPVAFIVTPIGGEQLLPSFLHRLDAFNLESTVAVALNKVERLRAFRQGWEMKRHPELAVLVRLHILVRLNAVGRDKGIALSAHFQVSAASEPETVAGIVRPQARGDIHYRFCLFQFHPGNVECQGEEPVAVAGSILSGGILPHNCFLLRLPRCCNNGKQDGNDCFLAHCLFFTESQ